MKPFNLERALAGDPVCTRDGLPVTFGAYNKDAITYHQVIGWVDGRIHAWSIAGRYMEHRECPDDLVMAPIKRKLTGWVNWYPDGNCYAWPTKEKADSSAMQGRIACVEVSAEIEE